MRAFLMLGRAKAVLGWLDRWIARSPVYVFVVVAAIGALLVLNGLRELAQAPPRPYLWVDRPVVRAGESVMVVMGGDAPRLSSGVLMANDEIVFVLTPNQGTRWGTLHPGVYYLWLKLRCAPDDSPCGVSDAVKVVVDPVK